MIGKHKISDYEQGYGSVGREIEPSGAARLKNEADRIAAIKAAAQPPSQCGAAIIAAPARGGFVLQRIRHMDGMTREDFVETPDGYVRRSPIRRGDVFDAMEAAALRRKEPCPLTPGQIAIGRRYHDLVELLNADGTKLSQLQASSGGLDGRDWMDRRLLLSAELDRMRQRLGVGPAMVLRRVRPKQRKRPLNPGERAPEIFTRRDLVDGVCVRDLSIKRLLLKFDWTDSGRNCKAALQALSEALDDMVGYQRQKNS